MPNPLLKSPDTLQVGVLNCDVEERNDAKKESFSLLWEDLTVEVRRQERTRLLEWNSISHERYEMQHQDTFLVQRSPTLKIQIGRLGEKMKLYHLPYQNVLPVPLFTPSKLPSKHQCAPQECKVRTEVCTTGPATGGRRAKQITSNLQTSKPSLHISGLIAQQNVQCPSLL